jgi:hypothetical protein
MSRQNDGCAKSPDAITAKSSAMKPINEGFPPARRDDKVAIQGGKWTSNEAITLKGSGFNRQKKSGKEKRTSC